MTSIRKITNRIFKDEKAVKKVLDETQSIIKSVKEGKTKKIKPKDQLLDLSKIKEHEGTVKVDGKIVGDSKKGEVKTIIRAKDFKVEIPKADDQADQFLSLYKKEPKLAAIIDDFNLEKINSKEDIAKVIRKISELYKEQISKHKRGVQTHDDTKRLASLLQVNPDKLASKLLTLSPGSTMDAAHIYAARELLEGGLLRLDELAEKAFKGGSLDDAINFRQHFALMSQLQKNLKGVQTEVARATNQFRIKTRVSASREPLINLDALTKNRLLVEMGGVDDVRHLADLYLRNKTATKRAMFTDKAGFLTKASKAASEVFIQVILSNPYTQVKNTAGSWVSQAIAIKERKMAAKISGDLDDIEGVAKHEDIALMYGMHQASLEMWGALKGSFKKNFGFRKKSFGLDFPENEIGGTKIEIKPGAFTAEELGVPSDLPFVKGGVASGVDIMGKLLTLNRMPVRALNTTDAYFKKRMFRGEMYAVSFRDAMKQVDLGTLNIKDAPAYIADNILHPSPELVDQAVHLAQYTTFTNPLNKRSDFLRGAKFAQTIKSNLGWFDVIGNYYFPFTQTPTNIAGYTLERMPVLNRLLGGLQDDLKAGGSRAALAQAKLKLGRTFFMTFAPLGYLGYVSGSDPQLGLFNREMEKVTGYQPKAIRFPWINDKKYQINLTGLDPISMMAGMSADVGTIGRMWIDDHDQARDHAMVMVALTVAIGDNILTSTNMQGAANLSRDVQNFYHFGAEKGFDRWSKNFTSSFVPSGAKQVGKFFWDNKQKLAVEWEDFMKKNIAEGNMNNDVDVLGRSYKKWGTFRELPADDPIVDELKKLNPKLNPIRRTISEDLLSGSVTIPLTSDELYFVKQRAGDLTWKGDDEIGFNGLNWLYQSDEYTNPDVSESDKDAMTKTIISAARSQAFGELRGHDDYKESLVNRLLEADKTKIITRQRGEPLSKQYFEPHEKILQELE
jgi:hypothetical protein